MIADLRLGYRLARMCRSVSGVLTLVALSSIPALVIVVSLLSKAAVTHRLSVVEIVVLLGTVLGFLLMCMFWETVVRSLILACGGYVVKFRMHRPDATKWAEHNLKGFWLSIPYDLDGFVFCHEFMFLSATDAVHFKLRWVGS